MTPSDRLRILSHGAANETVADDILAIADEFDRLESRHAAALELLREAQWSVYDRARGWYCCQSCRGLKPHKDLQGDSGHTPDCKLALLLCQPAAVDTLRELADPLDLDAIAEFRGESKADVVAGESQDPPPARCHDCLRPYGDEHGFPDLVIPDDAWRAISPAGDQYGLLCPSCICRRLHAAGIECRGTFRSGPLSRPAAVASGEGA
jgi:hypothetical protein